MSGGHTMCEHGAWDYENCVTCESEWFDRMEQSATLAARLAEALRDIKTMAEGHHEGQPAHVLLHTLTIDIPHMVDVALSGHREEE